MQRHTDPPPLVDLSTIRKPGTYVTPAGAVHIISVERIRSRDLPIVKGRFVSADLCMDPAVVRALARP